MSITRINQSQFNQFGPQRSGMITILTQEKAWFADPERRVLGTVLLDNTDKDWSYVVLGRDERGKFRAIDINASLPTQEAAEQELKDKMQCFVDSGETVFPQGDYSDQEF